LRERDVDRPAPDVLLAGGKADDKVLIFARRLAVLEWKANDLVAGMEFAVPRAVQGDERVSFPRGRKLIAFVEGEAKWRGVRLQGLVSS
jgi:hypothetical protein